MNATPGATRLPATPDELTLLKGAAASDPAAVRSLLDHAGSVVYGFVLGRVAGNTSAAEDIVQETFLQAVRSADTFRGEAALTTWLCGIARHLVAHYYERERREELARSGLTEVRAEVELLEDEAGLEAAERRQQLLRALAGLSVLHRQVLVLKYLDGCSVEEIAAELGRTRVQVQSLLQRARDGLRRRLEGESDA